MEEGYFNVKDPLKIGQPDIDKAYIVTVEIKIFNESFDFLKPVKYKFTDPVKGEVYQPVIIAPPVLVTVNPETLIKIGSESPSFNVSLKAIKKFRSKDAALLIDGDITPGYLKQHLVSIEENKSISNEFKITDTVSFSPRHIYLMNGSENEIYSNTLREIHYDHIPNIDYYKTSKINVKQIDLKTYNKKIGYIIGAGDKVPEALEQMGYEVTLLTDKELSRNNLKQFDAIISGVRAYNTNEWLNKYYDKLMKYVNDGGNYIVQYNTSNFVSSIKNKIGPYDFTVSRTRITDENAFVNFLKPEHPVLNFPNKITTEDFKGWVQERSIYHAEKWDKNFETIFSMNDPGEKADEGSLIISKYGKGYFTYTGIVFFRELPAGVPGAYRLLANLIALNRKKAF
jgi:uncharacterized protein YifN (PemK superfamily)